MREILQQLIQEEEERQSAELSLIASENYASKAVRETLSTLLTNKYAEGYPGRRYYAGNRVIDEIEKYAQEQARAAFRTDYHVNVQPYSGSSANLAAYHAVLEPGDTILAMGLPFGGHLTHGHPVSVTGKTFNFIHYSVGKDTELIDYDEVLALAREHKPKLIVAGSTAYPAITDYAAFSRIARDSKALLMVDMAHVSGLIAGGVHPTPFALADIITTSTHKTLRGPRGGMIFCRPELAKSVDRSVFPGLQGGPHLHTIAALAVALEEAQTAAFATYAQQVISNAKAMAFALQQRGMRLVSDGTDTHLMLLDLVGTGLGGNAAQLKLEEVGLITNKNMIPYDQNPPTDPSGLRLGTAALTTRGMKEGEMVQIAHIIAGVLGDETTTTAAADAVRTLSKRFRIPGL
jgi:glycine hydroxymethyltransferase